MLTLAQYLLKYSNRDQLKGILYKNSLEDIICCHIYGKDLEKICNASIDEILFLAQKYKENPISKENGCLTTSINGDLNEIIWTKKDDKERYDMMLCPWSDWFNRGVDENKSKEEICEAVVLTMTFCGFTEESQKNRITELLDQINESLK